MKRSRETNFAGRRENQPKEMPWFETSDWIDQNLFQLVFNEFANCRYQPVTKCLHGGDDTSGKETGALEQRNPISRVSSFDDRSSKSDTFIFDRHDKLMQSKDRNA